MAEDKRVSFWWMFGTAACSSKRAGCASANANKSQGTYPLISGFCSFSDAKSRDLTSVEASGPGEAILAIRDVCADSGGDLVCAARHQTAEGAMRYDAMRASEMMKGRSLKKQREIGGDDSLFMWQAGRRVAGNCAVRMKEVGTEGGCAN